MGARALVASASAAVAALLLLLRELLFGERLLGRARLSVKPHGVDLKHLLSSKGKHLTAFTDGSVLSDGRCGLSVYYNDGHPLNFHGGFEAGQPAAQSNLAELAALYWVLLSHPRGQHLTVFSDSAHALRVVQANSDDPERAAPRRKKRRADADAAKAAAARQKSPALDPRERCLATAIGWLLRLRTAQTCFFKVGAHKGFKQNEMADALAQAGAQKGPPVPGLPLRATPIGLCLLLLRYLLGQHEQDGGVPASKPEAVRRRRDGGLIRKPEPLGPSREWTRVVAIDCEMVGCGPLSLHSCLASVAIVNAYGNQVYFSYAKPGRRVSDYRTQWSGVTQEMLQDAPPAAAVQREVAALLADRIIVGHSLENDFGALGFHPPLRLTRDTARDVPRLLSRAGRPRKLRRLAWEFLGLTIQDAEGETGHSPIEDAQAALLLYKRFEAAFEARAAQRAEEAEASARLADGAGASTLRAKEE